MSDIAQISPIETAKIELLLTMRNRIVEAKNGSLEYLEYQRINEAPLTANETLILKVSEITITELTDILIADIDKRISNKDY